MGWIDWSNNILDVWFIIVFCNIYNGPILPSWSWIGRFGEWVSFHRRGHAALACHSNVIFISFHVHCIFVSFSYSFHFHVHFVFISFSFLLNVIFMLFPSSFHFIFLSNSCWFYVYVTFISFPFQKKALLSAFLMLPSSGRVSFGLVGFDMSML